MPSASDAAISSHSQGKRGKQGKTGELADADIYLLIAMQCSLCSSPSYLGASDHLHHQITITMIIQKYAR